MGKNACIMKWRIEIECFHCILGVVYFGLLQVVCYYGKLIIKKPHLSENALYYDNLAI